MAFQADRARAQYRRAYALLDDADRRAQRPGLIMSAIYSTLLEEIERDGFRVLTHRTSLTPIRKLWLAWRTWVTARPPSIAQPPSLPQRSETVGS
jgi:phytoene synthase